MARNFGTVSKTAEERELNVMKRTTKVKIQGITPLLMHRFPVEPIVAMEKKSIAEQAELAAYRTEDKKKTLYIPGIALQRAFINGAAYSKGKGRASLQKAVSACFQVTPLQLDLGTSKYEIDSRPVVVPATKGRIIRHRPILKRWQVEFELEDDESLLSENQTRQVVDDTGSRVGLLDFRPERKGPYGRFKVVHWKKLLG